MKQKSQTDSLNETISLLEEKQAQQLILLTKQFNVTYDSLKPINLIESTFREISSSPEIKSNIVSNTIGIATGYLTKKMLFGASLNPFKRILGTLIQFTIGNVVSNHAKSLRTTGEYLLNRYMNHRKESKRDFHENGTETSI